MPSLGNDLALIRKELNLTLEDIQTATKIPPHILDSIENDAIFSDFEENTTYIRSYVRSYARALKIKDALIIKALDQQEKGEYSGFLGKMSDGNEFEYTEPEDDSDDQTSEAEQTEVTPEQRKKPDSTDKSKKTSSAKPREEPPSVRSVDWADMGHKFQPLKTQSKYWVGILMIILIILASLFAYYYLQNQNEETAVNEEPAAQEVVPDSLQLKVRPMESEEDPAENSDVNPDNSGNQSSAQSELTALPDTLRLTIYAAYDKLEPVRVYTDIMDNINPYWIEQGNAYQFDFVNTIRIRGQFSRMVLLFNGHLVQNIREQFYNPDTRLVEINRSFFENDPNWLSPPPDSLDIGVPAPNIIQNRPTFN